eukprot:Hpha_TRINITY_DN18912_c0_g1::TRINITY_DN18912_c0_g1_i1::g.17642::m.17642/K17917/SNX1_2; sorting nexin-1/2
MAAGGSAASAEPLPAGQSFDFSVADAEKKEAKGGPLDFSYWAYTIYARTNLPQYRVKNMQAVRRYNDFVWLRDQLVEDHPGTIVPPIPQKSFKGALEKVVGINADQLVLFRQRAMRKFLVRVGNHPVLQGSSALQEFLELDTEEFGRRVRNPQKKDKVEIELGAGERMKQLFGGGKAEATEDSVAWRETKMYVDQLESSLNMLKTRIELLVKRRRDTSSSLQEFGKAFAKVGEIEQQYEAGSLANALKDVGHNSEHLAIAYQEQADSETIQVVETIGYYVGLCNAVRECITRLLRMCSTRDILASRVITLDEERQQVYAAGKQAKARQLDTDIQKVTERRDAASRLVDEVEAKFKTELRRFHKEKQYDVKQMLKQFVDLQLNYSARMKKSWEALLPSVEAIRVE